MGRRPRGGKVTVGVRSSGGHAGPVGHTGHRLQNVRTRRAGRNVGYIVQAAPFQSKTTVLLLGLLSVGCVAPTAVHEVALKQSMPFNVVYGGLSARESPSTRSRSTSRSELLECCPRRSSRPPGRRTGRRQTSRRIPAPAGRPLPISDHDEPFHCSAAKLPDPGSPARIAADGDAVAGARAVHSRESGRRRSLTRGGRSGRQRERLPVPLIAEYRFVAAGPRDTECLALVRRHTRHRGQATAARTRRKRDGHLGPRSRRSRFQRVSRSKRLSTASQPPSRTTGRHRKRWKGRRNRSPVRAEPRWRRTRKNRSTARSGFHRPSLGSEIPHRRTWWTTCMRRRRARSLRSRVMLLRSSSSMR